MKLRGSLCLLLAAFIWGITFVAQLVGMDNIGPFTYGFARYVVGVAAILVIWYGFRGKRRDAKENGEYYSGWKAGMGAGLLMFIASAFQQCALQYTTAGKTAFITCLYIIFVPIISVMVGKLLKLENWIGAIAALIGLYCLSIKGDFDLNYGDVLAFICSVFWSFHIMYIDRFADKKDNIDISASQLVVCAVLNGIVAFALENVVWQDIVAAWFPIVFAGAMSSGIAFTLQIVGQKYAEPSHAAIIMSLESVFGAVGGWVVLNEQMSSMEVFGCMMMLMGMLITQGSVILRNHSFKI
ncbi:Permease of the drug/metabolite transporter (DMT) superfamily [Anaerovibrio sp. JC8]|uniref:DMT family transporter n=1 Tax=Anaerovibrio sp. JC8 TaxID=1240085 RepID=UPI000A0AFC08|nr:DMT family transporter [Anaerovibrio sp. JC8]ORT99509.1 Permease of the drug/metabolite transporter (DMT) superfamily [Anaerovibrio sp. JC8]